MQMTVPHPRPTVIGVRRTPVGHLRNLPTSGLTHDRLLLGDPHDEISIEIPRAGFSSQEAPRQRQHGECQIGADEDGFEKVFADMWDVCRAAIGIGNEIHKRSPKQLFQLMAHFLHFCWNVGLEIPQRHLETYATLVEGVYKLMN